MPRQFSPPSHHRPSSGSRWWLVGLLCALLLAAVGCSGSGSAAEDTSSGPRPLTGAEADRLAVVRFNLYQAEMRAVDASIFSAKGAIRLQGWINTSTHHAYALITPPGQSTAFLSEWNSTQVSAVSYTAGRTPPLPAPAAGWQTAELTASDSTLAAAQAVLVGLSSDRPDNPQLLLQGGAQWLRTDTVAGVAVDVISGPVEAGATTSNLHYWIDEQAQLRRLEARIGGAQWSRFDFADAPDVTF